MTMAAPGPDAGDLTARTRIRDAALRLFRAQGVDGTSIRDVAREAEVSSGLVQHHYRTKEALREACDAHVLSQLVRIKEQLVLEGGLDNPAFLAGSHPDLLDLYGYLARSMIDGSPAASAMFAEMVAATEQWLAEHHAGVVSDEHGYATLLVAMEIGALALHHQLSGALGADVLGPEGHLRLSRAQGRVLLEAPARRGAGATGPRRHRRGAGAAGRERPARGRSRWRSLSCTSRPPPRRDVGRPPWSPGARRVPRRGRACCGATSSAPSSRRRRGATPASTRPKPSATGSPPHLGTTSRRWRSSGRHRSCRPSGASPSSRSP